MCPAGRRPPNPTPRRYVRLPPAGGFVPVRWGVRYPSGVRSRTKPRASPRSAHQSPWTQRSPALRARGAPSSLDRPVRSLERPPVPWDGRPFPGATVCSRQRPPVPWSDRHSRRDRPRATPPVTRSPWRPACGRPVRRLSERGERVLRHEGRGQGVRGDPVHALHRSRVRAVDHRAPGPQTARDDAPGRQRPPPGRARARGRPGAGACRVSRRARPHLLGRSSCRPSRTASCS
jgi:hypothetical protein